MTIDSSDWPVTSGNTIATDGAVVRWDSIDPAEWDDPNDSDPEGQAALDREADRAAMDAWEINDIVSERLSRRVARVWNRDPEEAQRQDAMGYPLTPEDFRAAAARVVELRAVRVPEDSGAYDRRACCVRGKLGRSCGCVRF